MRINRFYDALPKRKIEFIDGQLLVAGSLAKSAMMMATIIEGYGAEYVGRLVPKDLLLDAMAGVFGRTPEQPPMADFSPCLPSFPASHWVSKLRMSIWKQGDFEPWGPDLVVRLGENAFMPDLFFVKHEHAERHHDYFLDGPPDLILEVSLPFTRAFDEAVRLPNYAAAGVPEVWWVDWKTKSFQVLLLENGAYQPAVLKNGTWQSRSLPELQVNISNIFEDPENALTVISPSGEPRKRPHFSTDDDDAAGWGSLPFAPRLAAGPVPIRFDEFISWGGEIKFEFFEGLPVFGGGDTTTREYLGLLLMTLGVEEAVRCLPREAWERVI